ncbi:MAG: DNA mismatch repair endonuclease MutL [Chloroflexi bacterium]|nr:DNA mismatch repair endonuclease MutL [Chloroflexota bacterium]
MTIRILSSEVAAKIAAGEVVERPASVVKELIENSLDAGARHITIENEGGGTSLLRVSDDGMGIPAAEVELAFAHHATSKINALADLDTIATLGFRGEALPSIAAVAEVNLLTRAPGETVGTHLHLKEGRIAAKGQHGCPQGTTVTVRHLFRNLPARLKFLKAPATENGHLGHLVSQYALAFPRVRFTLTMDGRTLLRTPGSGSWRDALIAVYGVETGQVMLEVKGSGSEGGIAQVEGFISPPSISRAHRRHLSFFVNQRWVQSPLLTYAVEEAYQGLLMTGRHPMAILRILLPPREVDVNVHPAKREVRFRQERGVFEAVQRAVRANLIELAPMPTLRASFTTALGLSPSPTPSAVITREDSKGTAPSVAAPLVAPSLPLLRVLGQLSNTFIIAEGPDGMYLIDQHTAHERVLFDKLQAQKAGHSVEVQGLLEPLVVEVTPSQAEVIKAKGQVLAGYGFDLEPFGQSTYLMRALPALMSKKNPKEEFLTLLDSLAEEIDPAGEKKLAISLACQGAVKAGQVLSLDEMRELIRQLEATAAPNTCPHGRPTMIHLSSAQLEREFGRR